MHLFPGSYGNRIHRRIHTSFRGWTRWSDSILSISILGRSNTFGFSNTMCSAEDDDDEDCVCTFWRCDCCAAIVDDGENASTPRLASSKDSSVVNIIVISVRNKGCCSSVSILFGRRTTTTWTEHSVSYLCSMAVKERCSLTTNEKKHQDRRMAGQTVP